MFLLSPLSLSLSLLPTYAAPRKAKMGEQTPPPPPPSNLPPGWNAVTAADGRVYYVNTATNETTWTVPEQPAYEFGNAAPPPAGYAAPAGQPQWSAAPQGAPQQKKGPSTGKVFLGALAACCVADAIF